jgi:PAS domain S-box-containing protein
MNEFSPEAGQWQQGTEVSLLSAALAQAPFAALLFSPDEKLTLLWRNEAHAAMSGSQGVNVIGHGMFEAYPPSKDAEGAAAKDAIYDAVEQMRITREAVDIGPYRYDLQDESGNFVEHHWQIRMSPVVIDGDVEAILQISQDVTRAVLDAKLSSSLKRAAAMSAAVSYFSYDPETDHFVRTTAIDEMFGFAPGEAGPTATPFFDRVHPDDLPAVHAEVQRVVAAGIGEIASFDYRVPNADGSARFLRVRGELVTDPEDRRQKLVGTFIDLTDVEQNRAQLECEVNFRNTLVQEANHRIKNSLAIALSMLRMETRALANGNEAASADALASLCNLQARIGAISSTHDMMRLDSNRVEVSLRSLLEKLVAQTSASAGLPEDGLTLVITGKDRLLDSDRAISLGLVMNELLTNALKYGLHTAGEVDLKIYAEAGRDAVIITVDNAVETEAPVEEIDSSQLGSRIVGQIAGDLGATVERVQTEGRYTVVLTLPLAKG